jgi:argininosuccinate synthase
VEIGFEKGIPVTVNGEKLPPVELMKTLNKLAEKTASVSSISWRTGL